MPLILLHPRGCGEHVGITIKAANIIGSSPRARGTQQHRPAGRGQRRFIPAGAGNTDRLYRPRSLQPVHPRGCGEHAKDVPASVLLAGSSPRVRGTQDRSTPGQQTARFIPAGAGNTSGWGRQVISGTVHPRGCGEHDDFALDHLLDVGSSPRVRGTRLPDKVHFAGSRFIPAGAGNTGSPEYRANPPAVHPRGCGEHLACILANIKGHGSSPRVRGTLEPDRAADCRQRFIPAGAGNTSTWSRPAPSTAVHPRGCGEHYSSRQNILLARGSSPRVRGTLWPSDLDLPYTRFIPAGAGNTSAVRQAAGRWAVHPRGCGEHPVRFHAETAAVGSSPRVRGTLRKMGTATAPARFIPAGAGNTRRR